MCGIVGSINDINNLNHEKALKSLSRRGPDNSGEFTDFENNLWLGHTRLSIQDTSEKGNQPMFLDYKKDLVIVFNGEIYNYKKLKKEFELDGISFNSNSDTEILLWSYKKYGKEIFKKIEGMYAFAIWDKSKKSLILARDPIGQKPLYYYYSSDGVLYFGSTLNALLSLLPFKPNVSKKAFAFCLSLGYIPNNLTVYEGINSVEKGHFIELTNEKSLEINQYWDVNDIPFQDKKIDNKIENFNSIFQEVCFEHLISDVPVGLLLSGGLDSSSIAYSLRNSNNLTTYSLNFDSEQSESDLAEESAKSLGLRFKKLSLFKSEINNLQNEVANFSNQPQGYSSLLTWFSISKEISKYVKVIISGDGGDEVFGGYKWYRRRKKRELFLNLYRSISSELDFKFYKYSLKSELHRHWILQFPRFLPEESCDLLDLKNDIFNDDILINQFQKYFCKDLPLIDSLKRVDLMTFCSDHICKKTDEMSMAHSLEVRAPFLDRRIIEFGLSHRTNEYDKKNSKKILRNFIKNKLPKKVVSMEKKGFSLINKNPNYQYLINEIKSSKIVKDGIIRDDFGKSLLIPSIYRNSRIFTLANLSKWYEINVE